MGSEYNTNLVKNSKPKSAKKPKKRIFNFFDKNIKENSKNNLFNSNRDTYNRKKVKKLIKNIKKFNLKNRKEKILKYNNSFKTIRLTCKYKLNKEKDKDKDKNKETIANIKNIHYLKKRPLSSYLERRSKVYTDKHPYNMIKFEFPKLFKEPRIQYLNSDIIDLI